MKMEQTGCSETSAHKLQTPGNNSEESIQHLEHGESLKSWCSKELKSKEDMNSTGIKKNFPFLQIKFLEYEMLS